MSLSNKLFLLAALVIANVMAPATEAWAAGPSAKKLAHGPKSVSNQHKTASSPPKAPAAAAPMKPTQPPGLGQTGELLKGDLGKGPTYIKSDSLTLRPKDRIFTYQGSVEVKHQDMILSCDSLEGAYDEKNQIKTMTASRNVVITKGDSIQAHSEKAVFEGATSIITLTESPELQQNGSVLTADRIKILMKENRSVAEGAVRVKMVKGAELGAASGKDLFKPNG